MMLPTASVDGIIAQAAYSGNIFLIIPFLTPDLSLGSLFSEQQHTAIYSRKKIVS